MMAMLWGLPLLSVLAHAAEPPSTLVDRVEVVVGERVLTRSDLHLEAELARRIPSSVYALRLQETLDTERAVIERAIIRDLAAQVSIYQPTPAAVQALRDELRATFPDGDAFDLFLRRHGLTEDSLTTRLAARLIVERYVHRNIDLASQAAREDQDAYLTRYATWIAEQRLRTTVRLVEDRP